MSDLIITPLNTVPLYEFDLMLLFENSVSLYEFDLIILLENSVPAFYCLKTESLYMNLT